MAKAPLTFETAKRGDTYTSADGKTFKRIQSPYDPSGQANISVLMEPGAPAGNAPAGPSPAKAKIATAVPAEIAASQPPAAVESAAADPAVQVPNPAPAPFVAEPAPPVGVAPADNIEADHTADLQARQSLADKNAAYITEMHAGLAATPPPSNTPPPVPTIAPQPVGEASMLPTAAVADIARGVVEAPDMAISGARAAIHNLLGFSDHVSDLVEEHVRGTLYFKGFNHIGEPGNQLGVSLDTAANHNAHGLADPRPAAVFDRTMGKDTEAHSVTGGLVKGAAQFATGFAAGGALLKGWRAAAGAGAVAKGMAQGALSDFGAFDAHQQRLSDLLKAHAPEAIKPVLEYLASDPRDGEVEGRLKNALEGLGLGMAMHGIISAARHLRAARMIQRAAQISANDEGLQGIIDAPQSVVVAEASQFHADLNADLGDPNAAGFTTERKFKITRKFPLKPGEVADAADAGEMGPNTIGLNYAKIADGDDLQAAAVQFYDAAHDRLSAAKRGVQTIDQQVRDAFGEDVSRLLGEWRPGTAMASHELTALRFAQAGVMRDVLAHARAIAAGDSSLAKQAAFLQAGGVLDALSRAVEGGKAEAGRTLRTLRETVPSMTGDVLNAADAVEFYRKVDALVAGAGGKDMVERAAKAFLTVAKANPLGTSKFLRGLTWLGKFNDGSKDVIKVFMTNGLLTVSGITKNVFGNTSALVWERMMRQLAPKLSGMVGAPSYIADGEAIASQTAVMSAFQDVFRLADHVNLGWDIGAHGRAIADNFAEAKANTKGFTSAHREEVNTAAGAGQGLGLSGIETGPANDSPLGRAASLVYKVAKIPGQVHGVLDDFSNIISGRAELASQAYRQAQADVDAGLITAEQVGAQMQKHMEDPSAAMLSRVIEAQQNTSWTRPPDTSQAFLTKGIKGLRTGMDNLPVPIPLGTSVFPFINTPANIFSYGIQNSIFAPLSSRFRAAMTSADGATRQLAQTKYAVGSLFSLWVMNHVANGDITGAGPRDPAQRQAMMRTDPDTHAAIFQPYSARVGDHWVDLSGTDPFATAIEVSADMSEAWLGNDWSDSRVQTATDAFSASAMAVGNAFLSRSTMQGATQLMDALAAGKRGDVTTPNKFVENRAVALIPFSSELRTARRIADPYMRESLSITDKFKDSVPGLSATLPLSLDLWGRKRTYETGQGTAYDTVIPARTRPAGGEAADREMLRLGYAKQMPPKSITMPGGKVADLRNYPTIYNEILTRGGPAALEEINELVSGGAPNSGYYNSLADSSDQHAPGTKSRYLAGRLEFHFKQAVASVRRDFSDELNQIAAEQAGRRAAARAGP